MNVIEIEERIDEMLARGFKPADFIFDFIEAYGAPKSVIKQLRGGQQDAFGQAAVLWKRNVRFQLASEGEVGRVLTVLAAHKDSDKQKVRYIISTDGHDFGARDMKSGETLNCLLDELGVHFGFFLPLAGIERYKIADENPVDIKATGRLAKFYDSILQDNPTWQGDEKRHALNHFITQVVFCLFGEDTGILPPSLFSETIVTYCETDSTQAQKVLTDVFTAMSLSEPERGEDCPTYARKFPHVNGGLFKGAPEVPRFTKGSVRYLIDASQLNWRDINPDIFGSMIQSIVNTDQRGELGMHYTSVPNILKVLDPLFLDDLREQVNANWNNKKGLHGILRRLSKIRVFDPACGSGNFLVIAYRELRAIEIQVINRLAEVDGYAPPLWSHVELTNFYGIEYADFAAETAKLSLWITEYQMNSRYEDAFGKRTPALPLKETGNIVCGNALGVAWESVCPHSDDPEVETYIVGNPPYLGSKWRDDSQKSDMDLVFASRGGSYKDLDYVAAWFELASQSILRGTVIEAVFVSTNSVCQGEQVSMLWPQILARGQEISFAYLPFHWRNLASQNAGVTVSIISIRAVSKAPKYLFGTNSKRLARNVSPYLIEADNLIVKPTRQPINSMPPMNFGSMPNDGGHLILTEEEVKFLVENFPEAGKFVRRMFGSQEFIKGLVRYCLWIEDTDVEVAMAVPPIRARIEAVRNVRSESDRPATNLLAAVPHRFGEVRQRNSENAIIVPRVSSVNRHYLPVGYIRDGSIIQDRAFAIYNCPAWIMALIASRIHQQWIATVCVRLRMDFSYSNTLGWNTFPVPTLSDEDKEALTKTAEGILLARDTYFEKTIAELYDPDHMKKDCPELVEAHQRNDDAVETIYNGRPFKNDTERLEHLFARYSAMVGNT
jgi:hypothetical protein